MVSVRYRRSRGRATIGDDHPEPPTKSCRSSTEANRSANSVRCEAFGELEGCRIDLVSARSRRTDPRRRAPLRQPSRSRVRRRSPRSTGSTDAPSTAPGGRSRSPVGVDFDSQAENASSTLVTRSIEKAQVSPGFGPLGLRRSEGRWRRRATSVPQRNRHGRHPRERPKPTIQRTADSVHRCLSTPVHTSLRSRS
jgi:hypothetical protein